MKTKTLDLVILLTATITPNSYSKLKITDPGIRKQQYLETLLFYIQKTEYKIVFTENSGDLLAGYPLFPNRVEYLSYNSKPLQPDRGIGYKELEIIEFAFQNSSFIKEAQAVAKITGRLKVLNFERFAKKFLECRRKESNMVYANSFKPGNMDCRCFFFTPDFWPYFKSVGGRMDVRYNFEASLWDAIHQYAKAEGKKYKPFYTPLRIEGMSGSFGYSYNHDLLRHYARKIRNLVRKFFVVDLSRIKR